jgi:hypothetical protein
VISTNISPLPNILLYDMSSLIRNTTVKSTMMLDKAFCKFINCSFNRSTVCRKEHFLKSRLRVYSSKNKMLLLLEWK